MRAGPATQKNRRISPKVWMCSIRTIPNDLGNIADYEQFVERLTQIYIRYADHLPPRSLPDHHRQEYQEGRQNISRWHGTWHGGLEQPIHSRMKKSGARTTSVYHPYGTGQCLGEQYIPPLLSTVPERMTEIQFKPFYFS